MPPPEVRAAALVRPTARDASAMPGASTSPGSPAHWRAELHLGFEHRAAGTVLCVNRHFGPLQVQKALYPEGRGTCHVALLHPPGGIAATDRLQVSVVLGPRAKALLTTPGAAKWYRSEGGSAQQDNGFSLAEDALLEWLPRESILFEGSRIATTVEVDLSRGAKYLAWEMLCFGRRASGERWSRGHLDMRTTIRRDGRLLWSELGCVDAGSRFGASSVGLAGFPVCGTFLMAGHEVSDELMTECRRASPGARATAGITRVPQMWIARYLGHSSEEGLAWFTRLWELLRPAVTGRAACAPRVWAC